MQMIDSGTYVGLTGVTVINLSQTFGKGQTTEFSRYGNPSFKVS